MASPRRNQSTDTPPDEGPELPAPADDATSARRYAVLEELQRVSTELRSLNERVEEARQRQRDLVVEAVDELGLRLPMVASVLGLSPQRVHSLKQEALTRRERRDQIAEIESQIAEMARQLDVDTAEVLARVTDQRKKKSD